MAVRLSSRRRCSLRELEDSLSGDEALGVAVLRTALTAPLFWIATNAGVDGAVVVNKVTEADEGPRLQRRDPHLRRPARRRCRRSGEGDALGGRQRGVGRADDPHHRECHRREARRGCGRQPRSRARSLVANRDTKHEAPRGVPCAGLRRIGGYCRLGAAGPRRTTLGRAACRAVSSAPGPHHTATLRRR